MGDDPRWAALMGLRQAIADAVGADELAVATGSAEVVGLVRSVQPARLWVSGRSVPSPLPLTTLTLEPPLDARRLCALWGIERPVAVSGDVHQRSWSIQRAGAVLPDPHGMRIAALPVEVGRWRIAVRLAARPSGPLPGVVAGASPAYDVGEVGGLVASLDVSPVPLPVDAVRTDDPRARELLAGAATAQPHWRGGWSPPADAMFVLVRESDRPAAGAAIRFLRDGVGEVSRVCVADGVATPRTGSALIDAWEGLALEAGLRRVRVDSSAFLHPAVLRVGRHGYTTGPPYDGDTDVPVWAERTLPGS